MPETIQVMKLPEKGSSVWMPFGDQEIDIEFIRFWKVILNSPDLSEIRCKINFDKCIFDNPLYRPILESLVKNYHGCLIDLNKCDNHEDYHRCLININNCKSDTCYLKEEFSQIPKEVLICFISDKNISCTYQRNFFWEAITANNRNNLIPQFLVLLYLWAAIRNRPELENVARKTFNKIIWKKT